MKNRLYQLDKPLVALSGGIASGKTSVSQSLQKSGLAVICADALVHQAYRMQSVKEQIAQIAPSALKEKSKEQSSEKNIDFKELRKLFFNDPIIKEKIEKLIYAQLPALFQAEAIKHKSYSFLIYDIPLLFEKKKQDEFDAIILVSCHPQQQLQRLIQRDQIDEQLAQKILKAQIPIEEKRQMADYVIDNSRTWQETQKQVDELILKLRARYQ